MAEAEGCIRGHIRSADSEGRHQVAWNGHVLPFYIFPAVHWLRIHPKNLSESIFAVHRLTCETKGWGYVTREMRLTMVFNLALETEK